MNERPAILPEHMKRRLETVYKDGRPVCRVVLSEEGLLVREVSRTTGISYNPLDFAVAVVDMNRRFR